MARVYDETTVMERASTEGPCTEKHASGDEGNGNETSAVVEAELEQSSVKNGWLCTLLTGASNVQDESQFGVRCQVDPTTMSQPYNAKCTKVLMRLPGHFLREGIDALPTLILISIDLLLHAYMHRSLVQEFPMPNGGSLQQHLKEWPIVDEEGGFVWHCRHSLKYFICLYGACGLGFIWGPLIWRRMKAIYIRATVVFVLVYCANVWTWVFATYANPSKAPLFDVLAQTCQYQITMVYLCYMIVKMQMILRRLKQMLLLVIIVVIVSTAVVSQIILANLGGTDSTKFIIGLFIAWPYIIGNVLLRMIERSLQHCDPTVRGFWQFGLPSMEKLNRRLLLCSMKSPWYVLLASVCSTLSRLLFSTLFGEEDWRIYQFFGARKKLSYPMENVHLPKYGWVSERNATYQVNCFVLDASNDCVLILAMGLWRVAYDVGDSDGIAVSYWDVLVNVGTQLIFTMIMNAGLALYVSLYLKIDFVSCARCKFKGWTIAAALFGSLKFSTSFINVMPAGLCVSSSSSSVFHFCGLQ